MLTKAKILASVENVYDARFMRQQLRELVNMFYPFTPDNPFQADTLGYEAYEEAEVLAAHSHYQADNTCDDEALVVYMREHAPLALAQRQANARMGRDERQSQAQEALSMPIKASGIAQEPRKLA